MKNRITYRTFIESLENVPHLFIETIDGSKWTFDHWKNNIIAFDCLEKEMVNCEIKLVFGGTK